MRVGQIRRAQLGQIRVAKSHQTAVRPKPAKHGSEPEPKQVQHGNQVIADRLCRPPCEVVDFTAGQDCDEGQNIHIIETVIAFTLIVLLNVVLKKRGVLKESDTPTFTKLLTPSFRR